MNLFSQRIYQEHPIFNWALQGGDNDFVYDQSGTDSPESGVYAVAFGCPPIFRYPDGEFQVNNSSGAVRYKKDSTRAGNDPWDRDRIPMVIGSNGTTVVNENTPELESNLFLTASGQSDTFVFEFWMRVVGQGRDRIKILQSRYNPTYGLWLKGTVLTFVYGRTFCSYDVQVVDVPIYVSLYAHSTGIGLLVNGEAVAFSEFEYEDNHYLSAQSPNPNAPSEDEPGFDVFFVENDDVFLEVDGPSVFGYAQDSEIIKRRYVWGQGAGDLQTINNNFDGQSAFSNFNASELPGHAAYPLNYRWESGAKDNLVVWQDKLSFRYPKLPVHSFIDTGPSTRTKEDWFLNMPSDKFGPYVSSEGQAITTFDFVGSFVDDPVSMFLSGTNFGVTITSVFFPGYEVYITPETVYWSLDRSGTTDESVATSYFFPEVEQYDSYDNFILFFENFDPELNYEIWNMFQQPEGLKVTISEGIIESLGFGSRTQQQFDNYNDYGTLARIWKEPVLGLDMADPSYLWKGSTEFGFFYEDVELRGYWEDYITYNKLAAVDESGEFDIDYLQFNISHLNTGITPKLEWHDSVGVAPSNSLDQSNWPGPIVINPAPLSNNMAIPSKDAAGDPYGSVLRLYLKFETDGYFTNPIQLNKLSVSTYHGDIIKTKGLSIDKHDGNFLYDTDSMPFLTLGKDSGFCSDEEFDVLLGDVENVGAIQFFVRINAGISDGVIASFSGHNVEKTGNVLTASAGDTLIVNGEEVDESDGKTVQANEWHCVALVFDSAVDESDGSITMASGYNFDNIGYFLNTSDMVQTMKNVWQAYTMSESLEFISYQPMELIQSDIAAYPGISWQQVDIDPL